MTLEIALAFGILIVAIVLFFIDIFPHDFVAIAILAMVLAFRDVLDVSVREAISGFSNPATITVMAVFILSAGIQRTGTINVISRYMIAWGGTGERRQLLTIQAVAGPSSAFINNTAAVAILIPAVIRMAREASRSPSKLLIPLSFGSQLAGIITLIGTSTNILASELSDEAGIGGFSMFEFSTMGLIIFGVGVLYLLFVAPHLLPDHETGAALDEQYRVRDYLSELLVPENSNLVGQTISGAALRQTYGFQVLEILRLDQRRLLVRPDTVLQAGDVLMVAASAEQLVTIRDRSDLMIEAQARLDEDELPEEIRLVEVVIGPNSDLIGGTLISTNFRNRYDTTVIAMRKEGQVIRERLGRIRLAFGDTLLLQGPACAIERLYRERGFIVTEGPRVETFRTERIPVAIAIIAAVILFATFGGQPIIVTAIIGAVAMVLTGCLTMRELHESIRWDVLFLLAGMIPLGIALQNTGGAEWLADIAVSTSDYLPSVGVLAVFYVVTSLLTATISNNAAIVVMVPVGIVAAQSLGADPRAFVLAIMFAASTSFATPIGYQTNTMVLGPGGYSFSDYLRVGGLLNIILAILTPAVIWLVWGL